MLNMKRIYLFLIGLTCLILFIESKLLAEDDEFNVERLPLGNPATKYDFVAVKVDQIFDAELNQHIDSSKFFARLAEKRVVMVGESHTNAEHHRIQLEVIKGLTEAGKKVCLALEMFNPTQNQALDDFIEGKYAVTDFMDSTRWFDSWGYNYRMYQPIFEYTRAHKIKIFGVNTKREYASLVGKKGVQGLSPEEMLEIPAIDTTNNEHRFLIKAYFTGSDALTPELFSTKYQAQCLWDAAMAEGAIKAARENPEAVVVVLAGSGHVAYNLGIGKVIHKRSGLPLASVIAIDVPKRKGESLMERMHKYRKKKKAKKDKNIDKDSMMKMDRKPKMSPMGKMPAKKQMPTVKVTKKGKMPPAGMPQKGEKTPGKMPTKEKMSPAMLKMMQAMSDTTPYKIVVRSLADFLLGVPDTKGKAAYPSLGVRLGEKSEKGFEINNVYPESIAEKNGIEADDLITAIDGKTFECINEFKKYLYTKNWSDSITVDIIRADKSQKLEFELKLDDADKEPEKK